MSLTPEDIIEKEFKKSFSVWSYDDQEVDSFLDLVADYYEDVLVKNDSLKLEIENLETKVEELEEELNYYHNLEDSLQQKLDKVEEEIANKKEKAEKEANLIIREAELEAKKIKQQAKEKVEEKYNQYHELREHKKLFEIKFKTLLKSHLEMLEEGATLETVKDEIHLSNEED